MKTKSAKQYIVPAIFYIFKGLFNCKGVIAPLAIISELNSTYGYGYTCNYFPIYFFPGKYENVVSWVWPSDISAPQALDGSLFCTIGNGNFWLDSICCREHSYPARKYICLWECILR